MAARPANPRLANDIIEAAAALVEEGGPEGVTMRLVANSIGYSATTIYLYFKNKEQLLDETVNRAFDWFADHLERASAGCATQECIRKTAHAYVDWALANPGMYRLMFEWTYPCEITTEAIFARRAGWRRMRQYIERGMDAGIYRANLDSAVATDMMWVAIHGLASLAISGRIFGSAEMVGAPLIAERSHALVDTLTDGWEAAWRAG